MSGGCLWDLYGSLSDIRGRSIRDTAKQREIRMLFDKEKDSLSYHSVLIDGCQTDVMIINTDNLNEKHIFSLPDWNLRCGGLVEWMDNYWLITEKDANNELYTKGKLVQCNYELKWVDPDDRRICCQWCIVEDGTKLRRLVSAQRNLCVKISIEMLGHPKAYIATACG